ncbi:unnamed protein product [Toxocara canis]|uniref:Abhydrolase_4 domain-containing protein n=1 Tax=Toxocara canis TaxID=6265 RepID=A0A183U0E4_TOXCA|nr:unnamed protein product [Toxocara canis]
MAEFRKSVEVEACSYFGSRARKESIKNRFRRCVEKIRPRLAIIEGNYDPYGVFMKKALKSTTTMKKAVELGQAHLQYPRKLLKYIVMKVIVDRKRDYSSTDPWAVFFYSLYKPKKPFRYGFASGIEMERGKSY